MFIKTKLKIAIALCLVIFAVSSILYFNARRQIREIMISHEIADQISQSAFDLAIITNDYLLHQEQQSLKQWYLQHAALGTALEAKELRIYHKQETIDRLLKKHQYLYNLFQSLTNTRQKHQEPQAAMALGKRLAGQLSSHLQYILYEARQLQSLSDRRLLAAHDRVSLYSTITLGCMTLVILVILAFIYRAISPPLQAVLSGAKKLGEGDLEHRLEIAAKNEIGELAEAFNEMSSKLSGSLKSLENEVMERKQAELQIGRAKEEWERTFNSMGDIITIQDKEMRIVRANKAAHDLLQATPGELKGRYCYEVFRGADRPCSDCPELLTLKQATTHSANITYENLEKIFYVTSSPLINENNEFTHIVHVAKDITAQKKMEAELFQAQKMESIGTLAGGIAHDLNNILTPIFGYLDLTMIQMTADSAMTKNLNEVRKAAERAREMVGHILTFSRRESENLSPIQVHMIVKEALTLLRASLPTTIEIRQSIDTSCGSVLANPTQIHQIVMNLCTNASHAMRENGGILGVALTPLTISTKDFIDNSNLKPGLYLQLEVSDTGHGIDQETRQRIFEPYFTTKIKGEGTGMGLSVVHGAVKSIGGHITVYSEPGKGTTFHIYLPVIESSISQAGDFIESPIPTGTEKIMIVDDEESVRCVERDILKGLGYEVTDFADPIEALEYFTAQPDMFDLVVTDMTMPKITGDKLAQRIMAIRPDMPLILCTGFSDLVNEESAKAKGIREYVMKPIIRQRFARTLRSVLDGVKK